MEPQLAIQTQNPTEVCEVERLSFTQSDGYAHSHPSFAFCLTL